MVKLKTKKSAVKRFSSTGRDRIIRNKSGRSHLLRKKDSRRKRRLKRKEILATCEVPRVKRLLPHL